MDKNKVTDKQFAYLLYAGANGNALFIFSFTLRNAGRSAFISAIIGGIVSALFLLWVIYLANKIPGNSILDMIKSGYGKIFSYFIVIPYILYHIITGAFLLRLSISLFVKVFILQLTPLWMLLLIPSIIIGIFLYTEDFYIFARWNLIILFVATAIYAVGMTTGMLIKFDLNNILPIFHVKLSNFLFGSLLLTSGICETVINSFCIVGMMQDYKKSYLGFLKGIGLYIPIISTSFIFAVGILGLGVSARNGFPIFGIANEVGLGTYAQGLEIFHILPFLSLLYINLGYKAYCSLLGIYTITKKKKNRLKYVLLVCISMFAIALSVGSFNAATTYSKFIMTYVVIPFCIVFLILASIAVAISKRKSQQNILIKKH